MSDQPTGVFVQLPFSDEQRAKIVAEMMFAPISVSDAFAKAALRIGTPVTGGELDVVGYADSKEIDSFAPSADINPCAVIFAEEITAHATPLVRQSDAQAQIAALEAEVVRLREAIHKMIDMSRNAQTWSLNNRSASCRDELSAIGRLGEKTLKGGAA